jgi:hypothetical protein
VAGRAEAIAGRVIEAASAVVAIEDGTHAEADLVAGDEVQEAEGTVAAKGRLRSTSRS